MEQHQLKHLKTKINRRAGNPDGGPKATSGNSIDFIDGKLHSPSAFRSHTGGLPIAASAWKHRVSQTDGCSSILGTGIGVSFETTDPEIGSIAWEVYCSQIRIIARTPGEQKPRPRVLGLAEWDEQKALGSFGREPIQREAREPTRGLG